MKTVLFSSLAASGLMLASSNAGASDSSPTTSKASVSDATAPVANARKPGAPMPNMTPGTAIRPMMHGPRSGFHGIPRTDVYTRPHRGFVMPRYWFQPSFYIPNYRIYGLTAPSQGYNWSRYYDDAVLLDGRGYVQDYRSGIDWNAGYTGEGGYYDRPDYGPALRPDAQAYDWGDDGNVAFKAPDGSIYSYEGEWEGEFVDPEARVFEGEWEGTVTRHDGPPHPMSPPDHPHPTKAGAPYPPTAAYGSGDERGYADHGDNYRVPQGYEGYERCLKSNGVTGAAIGAIIGGFAGNRIAGRGDRLGGTILGAGVGGIAGAAIEKATDKCKRYEPRYGGNARGPYRPQAYPQGYPQGWQGGYYYPAPVVTIISGGPMTTTTVTEEVYYETVRTAQRKRAIRKWKPKPKPRCGCS